MVEQDYAHHIPSTIEDRSQYHVCIVEKKVCMMCGNLKNLGGMYCAKCLIPRHEDNKTPWIKCDANSLSKASLSSSSGASSSSSQGSRRSSFQGARRSSSHRRTSKISASIFLK